MKEKREKISPADVLCCCTPQSLIIKTRVFPLHPTNQHRHQTTNRKRWKPANNSGITFESSGSLSLSVRCSGMSHRLHFSSARTVLLGCRRSLSFIIFLLLLLLLSPFFSELGGGFGFCWLSKLHSQSVTASSINHSFHNPIVCSRIPCLKRELYPSDH